MFYNAVLVSAAQQNESAIFTHISLLPWIFFPFRSPQSTGNINTLLYACVRVCAKSLQSCLTLCDPMDSTLPGSSVHGILQARTLKWVSCPPPGDLPDPGIEPVSPATPALQGTAVRSLGRSAGEGIGYPGQYPCLENHHGQRNLWGCKESDTTK